MFLLNDSTHRMLMRFDAILGHRYVPNMVARVPHETGGYVVRTNSTGFRSDLEFTAARGSLPRILVFGDSFTAGEGCDSQQRYPELLGLELGVEVYNYGLSGSAPDQHLLCYREFAKHVQADLIVWGIPLHNIERIKLTHRPSRDRITGHPILVPKPYFTLEQGRLELHHSPVPRLRPEPAQARGKHYTESVNWKPPVTERLLKMPAFEAARESVQRLLPGLKEHIRALAYRISNTQLYDDYLDGNSAGWTLLSALIRQLRADANDIPILVVPLPTYHYYIDRIPPLHDDLYKTLESPASNLFVSAITQALHQGKTLEQRKALCFPVDTHYSPAGHRAIAELLAAEIRQKQLLPFRPDTGSRVARSVERQARGGKFVLGLVFGRGCAAAALVRDGQVIALAEESSFSGSSGHENFPRLAVNYCIEEAGINQDDLSAIIYGCELSSEFKSDAQLLLTTTNEAEWLDRMSGWVMRNLAVYPEIRSTLQYDGLMLESSSDASHCANAFYSSPFTRAALLHFGDALERNRTVIARGDENGLTLLVNSPEQHPLQVFKAAMTKFISDQATVVDVPLWRFAQGGEPIFADAILNGLLVVKDDASVGLNRDYFPSDMTSHIPALSLEHFFAPAKASSHSVEGFRMDLARSVQVVICRLIVRIAKHARALTGLVNLCVSGAIANDPDVQEALHEAGCFDSIWFLPMVGNASAAQGSALLASIEHLGGHRSVRQSGNDAESSGLLGPGYSSQEIDAFVDTFDYPSKKYSIVEQTQQIAALIAEGKIVGHFAGRLGVDPQYSGDRLVLSRLQAPPGSMTPRVDSHGGSLNFSPAVALADGSSVTNATQTWGKAVLPDTTGAAVWVRAIHEAMSPRVYSIIRVVETLTDCKVVATSTLGLPSGGTVCTPLDAYRIFMLSPMDALVLGEHILLKAQQPAWPLEPEASRGAAAIAIEAGSTKLSGALGRLFSRRRAHALPEVQVAGIREVSTEFGSRVKPLVSIVPPELEKRRIRRNHLAQMLVRACGEGSVRDSLQELAVDIVRLNRRYYNG